MSAPSPDNPSGLPGERFTRVLVTIDAGLVILLAFAFGFGNGWTTAQRLGIDYRIAPLIQPGVDLAVIGLMLGIRYLAIHGWQDEQLAKPRRWLMVFGLMTLGMNTALPIAEHQWGRAAWDAIGPILLIAWSDLAPWLLRAIYSVRVQQAAVLVPVPPSPPEKKEAPQVPAPEPGGEPVPVPVPVSARARLIDITSENLRTRVGQFCIDWHSQHKTYDGVIKAANAAYQRAYGLSGPRRISQLCKEEWDRLYLEGRISTPRPASEVRRATAA